LDEAAEVWALVQAMNSCRAAGDAAGAGACFAEDAALARPGGDLSCEGRTTIEETLLEEIQATRMRALEEHEDPVVRVWGDAAVVRYGFHARGFSDGRKRDWEGRELLVLARSAGAWRITWLQRL